MIFKQKIFCLVFVLITTELFLFAQEGILIIDDFSKKDLQKNFLEKTVFTFVSNKGVKNNCLKINYDLNLFKTSTGGTILQPTSDGKQNIDLLEEPVFAGYFSSVSGIDFTKYDYLILYLKGDREKGFSRKLRIELKDKKYVSGYTLEGITDEWQKFVIPISVFKDVNLKKITYLGIVFSSELVTNKQGSIYIDEIVLAKKPFVKQQKIKIKKVSSEITIDGDLFDWHNVKWYKLDIFDNLEMGKISSFDDLDGKFALQWDNEYLYLAIKVVDNEILCRETEANIWRDDCVEIYIDPQNDGLIWKNEKDYQIGVSPSGPENEPQIYAWFQDKIPSKDEVDYKVKSYQNGYNIEMKIKLNFLNLDVKKNTKIGFSISVQDVDEKDGSSGKLTYCWIKDIDKIFLAEAKFK